MSDMETRRMAYGKVLRSPIAHGLIKRIDTSKAEALEGVYAVITAKDTPKKKFSFSGGIVPDLPDKLVLCDDKVRYIGDEVAAVAAVSEEIAEEAVNLIEVEYEELPGVFDPEASLREGAPKVHEGGNVAFSRVFKVGDVDKAFAGPGLVFVEGTFATKKAAHVCFEPKSCIAESNGATGELVMTTTTQAPHTLKQELGRALGISPSKIRVIYPPSGGGFGSKLVMNPIEPIAALLSAKSGRPVKIVNSREEEFTTSRTDYPFRVWMKLGLTPQGRMIGVESKMLVDNGAYNDKGPAVLSRAMLALGSHYNIPNIRVTGTLAYTNEQYCTAYRGFGKPQAVFAVESIVEMAAEKIGMDSIELREANATPKGAKTPTGVPVYTDGLELCVKEAAARIGWADWKKRARAPGRHARGIGFAVDAGTAAGNRKYGFNSCDAFVSLSEDGRAKLISSIVEIGTGASTSLAQIVAQILGLSVEDVEVVGYDTDVTPYDLGIFGNRSLFIQGNAAASAAENAKKELIVVASAMLGQKEEDLIIENGYVRTKADDSRKVSVKGAAQFSFAKMGRPISAKGSYIDADAPLALEGKAPIDPTYSFAAHAVEVDVDRETGVVTIARYVAAHDSGTIVNPLTAKGVVIGGTVQGIGYTLMEELMMEEGRVLNPNFLDYKIPGMEESPMNIEVVFVNAPDPLGPFGAKGLGENAVSPPVAAIANAVKDAIGIRFFDLPITPVKVLEAINTAGAELR